MGCQEQEPVARGNVSFGAGSARTPFHGYTFVHIHHTMKERRGVHTTPAMAAGTSDHVWKLDEIAKLAD